MGTTTTYGVISTNIVIWLVTLIVDENLMINLSQHYWLIMLSNLIIDWLLLPGRTNERVSYIEAYLKTNKLFRDFTNESEDPVFTKVCRWPIYYIHDSTGWSSIDVYVLINAMKSM